MASLLRVNGFLAVVLITLTATSPVCAQGMKLMNGKKPMGGMMVTTGPTVPPVTGYSEGQKILFIHTETSDQKTRKFLLI